MGRPNWIKRISISVIIKSRKKGFNLLAGRQYLSYQKERPWGVRMGWRGEEDGRYRAVGAQYRTAEQIAFPSVSCRLSDGEGVCGGAPSRAVGPLIPDPD